MDLRDGRYITPSTPATQVFFDTATPTTEGVIFDPDTPAASDTLYVSSTNSSTWIYQDGTYITYTAPVINNTEWYITGTTIDAGGNKTAIIQRPGEVRITNSTQSKFKTQSGTREIFLSSSSTLKNYLLATGSSFEIGTSTAYDLVLKTNNLERLKIASTGAVTLNAAYTLPTVAPTAGQVLGYLGAGTTTWVSGSSSGIVGIANSSGVYTYYATLNLAITAAVSGQTVDILTDITETGSVTVTTKTGVKINGNGYTYTLSVNDATNAITQAIESTLEIFNLKVVRTGRLGGSTGRVLVSNFYSNSTLKCQNVVFESTYGEGVNYLGFIYGLNITSVFSSVVGDAGAYNCNFTSSSGLGIDNSGSAKEVINCNVSASGTAINMTYGNVYNSTGRSSSGSGIIATKGYNCVGISTSGVGLNGTFTNSTGISTSGFAGSGGTKTNCTLISSSNYGSNLENLNNCFLQSTTNVPLWLSTGKLVNTCTAICLWDNVGGHAINTTAASTGVDIRNCNLTVTNASAYCINGASASTFKYASNTFKGSTTAVNTTNVTQGITNTEDNQGNILI